MVASCRRDPQCAILEAPKRANSTKMALHCTVPLRKLLYINYEALYCIKSNVLKVYCKYKYLACIFQMTCFYLPSPCTKQAQHIYKTHA